MFNHWIFKCKDITELISRSMDEELPLKTRIGVRLHLIVCYLCARYKKQVNLIHKAVSKLDDSDPSDDLLTKLPDDAADRIKAALSQADLSH